MREPAGFWRCFGWTRPAEEDTAMMTSVLSWEAALRRIRAEYLEMPGLKLTAAQAQRLWGFDPVQCEVLLAKLMAVGFLRRMRDGTYVRVQSGPRINE